MSRVKPHWSEDRTVGELQCLADAAMRDARIREERQPQTHGELAGSVAWKKREPTIAHALLKLLRSRGYLANTEVANLTGQVAIAEQRAADDRAAIRDVRFERDRMRLAYEATYDLVCKLAYEYVDPERLDDSMKRRIAELEPNEEPADV